eukprot:Lankesteria_metandrocarpae@DN4766_c0_g1_i1.p1
MKDPLWQRFSTASVSTEGQCKRVVNYNKGTSASMKSTSASNVAVGAELEMRKLQDKSQVGNPGEPHNSASSFATDTGNLELETQFLTMSMWTEVDELRQAQHRLSEIGTMMQVFTLKVSEQSEVCDTILDAVEAATTSVDAAKKHLEKARSSGQSYRFYVFLFYCVGGVFLLLFDWITS